MRKKILVGSLVAVSLALGACGSKEVKPVENSRSVESTVKAVDDKPTEQASEISKEASEEKTETSEVQEVAVTEEVTSEAEAPGFISDETTEMDMSFLDESVAEADVKNIGTQSLSKAVTSDLNETPEIMGYKMKTIRPFAYYDKDGIDNDYEKILSLEGHCKGNAIFHSHTIDENDTKSGYYYDDAHDGPCYIEEEIQVIVYPLEYQSTGWTFEEGEDLSTWLDSDACSAVKGEGSVIEKVNYSVNGRDWTVYYGQMGKDKDPKDDFSVIYCDGYFKEENGDYVRVELRHRNHPTLKTDNHVPSAEERMETAKQEYETMINTFEKAN